MFLSSFISDVNNFCLLSFFVVSLTELCIFYSFLQRISFWFYSFSLIFLFSVLLISAGKKKNIC